LHCPLGNPDIFRDIAKSRIRLAGQVQKYVPVVAKQGPLAHNDLLAKLRSTTYYELYFVFINSFVTPMTD
jgi:hypothetical protein